MSLPSAVLATFSCVNCGWFCSHSHQRRPQHSSTPSSVAALTTVTPCYMALQIFNFSDCSQRRTLLRGWLLTDRAHHADPEVSACGNGWLTSWQLSCTNALMVALRSTWQSSVNQASTDVQEWDQLMAGSSTCRVRRLHLVNRSFAIAGPRIWNGTTYLMPSEIGHLVCHS